MARALSRTWGAWTVEISHSTAILSQQGVAAVCVCFGSRTVPIFSCPVLATLAKQALFYFYFCFYVF